VDISINMTRQRIKEVICPHFLPCADWEYRDYILRLKFSQSYAQAKKVEVAALVHEKLLEGIVGTSEDETFIRSMRLALAEGEMEDNKIDVMVSPRNTATDKAAISVDSTPGFEVFKLAREGKAGKKGEKKKMTVAEARPIIEENEIERMMDEHDIPKEAIAAVEVG
jgi:ATP-dependent HslUV protease ATP-binding subunit HslU